MTRARELAKLGNESVLSVNADNEVGIGSQIPESKLDVEGTVTATTFSGSGSGLTGLPGQADFWIKTAAGINTTVSVGIGTTRPDSIARVNNTSITNVGILTAYQIYGDGSNLTGLPGQVDLWSKTAAGINTLSSVGVGTTNPVADLTVGPVGTSGTSLFVHGDARVVGVLTATSLKEGTKSMATMGKAVAMAMIFG
tara:strand:- start:21 stop:611 length:591 start_codon:yes stop_codon:yes gene_type:complete